MNTITINTSKSNAVDEWEMKEYGSWEDHKKDADHACALLQKFGGKLTLTIEQANNLICSGQYHSTTWHPDEIDGGNRTMAVIARYVTLIKKELSKIN